MGSERNPVLKEFFFAPEQRGTIPFGRCNHSVGVEKLRSVPVRIRLNRYPHLRNDCERDRDRGRIHFQVHEVEQLISVTWS